MNCNSRIDPVLVIRTNLNRRVKSCTIFFFLHFRILCFRSRTVRNIFTLLRIIQPPRRHTNELYTYSGVIVGFEREYLPSEIFARGQSYPLSAGATTEQISESFKINNESNTTDNTTILYSYKIEIFFPCNCSIRVSMHISYVFPTPPVL